MLHQITTDDYNTVPHESRLEGELRQEVASQVIDSKEVPKTLGVDSKSCARKGVPVQVRPLVLLST
jgi:hypothetical protein